MTRGDARGTQPGPSRRRQIVACVVIGVAVGVALLVARLGNAMSYLSDSPETCVNCHVMTEAYATWRRGSHGNVATCNDCHVPHTNVVAKTTFKAVDGLKHSYVFTARGEPQVIQLSKHAVPVVQSNCLRCHATRLEMVRLAGSDERKCWDCHRNVHGEARSLSAAPNVLRPRLPDAGLRWRRRKRSNTP